MTPAYGKLVLTSEQGAYVYNEPDGRLLWNTQARSGGVQAYGGNVYIGESGSKISCRNILTGEILNQFQVPITTFGSKIYPESLTVADGIVVGIQPQMGVFNANTGELIWETQESGPVVIGNPSAANGSSYILLSTHPGWNYDAARAIRISITDGHILWDKNGWYSTPAVIQDNRVIFWNFGQGNSENYDGHTLLCVDASTGATLWSYDTGVSIFEPSVNCDELLFGSSDGYFYALRMSDGTLSWKTNVDTLGFIQGNNLPAQSKTYSAPAVSQVVVNSEQQTALWGFLITQSTVNGTNGNDLYAGVVSNIDLTDGRIIWSSYIQREGVVSTSARVTPMIGLASLKNSIFLTAGLDMWTLDGLTGNSTWIEHFEHYLQSPVVSDNKMFVVADLYLRCYG